MIWEGAPPLSWGVRGTQHGLGKAPSPNSDLGITDSGQPQTSLGLLSPLLFFPKQGFFAGIRKRRKPRNTETVASVR